MKKELVLLSIVFMQSGVGAEQEVPVKSAPPYMSTDPAVNHLFDFFRKLYAEPEVSKNARYLADGLAIAEKNFNRDIDLSRTMINKLAEGLSRFNSDVSREVLYAEQLEELLARVSASFESRIRVIEDRKGIKRGIFS